MLRIFSAGVLLVLCEALALSVAEVALADGILIPNGGFEDTREDGSPVEWRLAGGVAGKLVNDARSGTRSVSCSSPGLVALRGWQTDLPVRQGRAYSVVGYVKTGAAIGIAFSDEHNNPIGTTVLSPVISQYHSDWSKLTLPAVTAPLGARHACVTVGLQMCVVEGSDAIGGDSNQRTQCLSSEGEDLRRTAVQRRAGLDFVAVVRASKPPAHEGRP